MMMIKNFVLVWKACNETYLGSLMELIGCVSLNASIVFHVRYGA